MDKKKIVVFFLGSTLLVLGFIIPQNVGATFHQDWVCTSIVSVGDAVCVAPPDSKIAVCAVDDTTDTAGVCEFVIASTWIEIECVKCPVDPVLGQTTCVAPVIFEFSACPSRFEESDWSDGFVLLVLFFAIFNDIYFFPILLC